MVIRIQAEKNKSDKRPKATAGPASGSLSLEKTKSLFLGDAGSDAWRAGSAGDHERAPEGAWGCRKVALRSLPPMPASWDAALTALKAWWERGLPGLVAEVCRVHSGPLSSLVPLPGLI